MKSLRKRITPKIGVMMVLGILLASLVGAGIYQYYYSSSISGEVYTKLLYNGSPMENYDEQYDISGFAGEYGNVSNGTIYLNANYSGYVDIDVNITTEDGLVLYWTSNGYYDADTIRIYPDQTIYFAVTYEFDAYAETGIYSATVDLT